MTYFVPYPSSSHTKDHPIESTGYAGQSSNMRCRDTVLVAFRKDGECALRRNLLQIARRIRYIHINPIQFAMHRCCGKAEKSQMFAVGPLVSTAFVYRCIQCRPGL